MKKKYVTIILSLISLTLFATIITIPFDYSTIQEGINASVIGDTVLVEEGEYFENINYNAKNIVVASRFILDGDFSHINNTIINGSQPDNIELASCVSLISGESSEAVLQGFTIREGLGYLYSIGNTAFREGGGIILDYSDAVIKNNIIIENESLPLANDEEGGGGGGIAAWFGNPMICNNVIINNTASYAAGLVLNYSAGVIRNNIVYANYGGEDFGAGGVMLWDCPDSTGILENNTIVGNTSETTAGGIRAYDTVGIIRNNIVWGNLQGSGMQVTGLGNSIFEYNDCEEFYNGTGMFSVLPDFTNSNFLLSDISECIDSGEISSDFNDIEDPDNIGNALFPSLGSLRNDVGAYGGPYAMEFPGFYMEKVFYPTDANFSQTAVNDTSFIILEFSNLSTSEMIIEDIITSNPSEIYIYESPTENIKPIESFEIILKWIPINEGDMESELSLYHNFDTIENPLIITLSGTALLSVGVDESPESISRVQLHGNYPNPFNPSTSISFELGNSSEISLEVYNAKGQMIKKLFTGLKEAGTHQAEWDGRDKNGANVSSGIYFYQLKVSGEKRETKKCILLK